MRYGGGDNVSGGRRRRLGAMEQGEGEHIKRKCRLQFFTSAQPHARKHRRARHLPRGPADQAQPQNELREVIQQPGQRVEHLDQKVDRFREELAARIMNLQESVYHPDIENGKLTRESATTGVCYRNQRKKGPSDPIRKNSTPYT